MTYDAIVVGAGIGGLACAAKLAKAGVKTLVLEKNPHIGGTSHVFKRNGYIFPMGPLSFSYPGRVGALLEDLGIRNAVEFRRNHFQLIAPDLEVVYSRPLEILKEELKALFPTEAAAIDRIVAELEKVIELSRDLDKWHPDYLAGRKREAALADLDSSRKRRIEAIREAARLPSLEILDRATASRTLINLLGSQGTEPPEMSLLNLAFMWTMMSQEGIWFPTCGIHGICDLLRDQVLSKGGEIRTGVPVTKILVSGRKAEGVHSAAGDIYKAGCVVSNADAKKTFLEMMDPETVEPAFLEKVRSVPYTASELCVYLGVRSSRIDFSPMKATHLFFRKEVRAETDAALADFDNREIEICRWSDNFPDSAPSGGASLILRVGFPYPYFAPWWTGEKKRRPGYKDYKNQLAKKLVQTVENILPGLMRSIDVMEIATPLTYRDWGQRTLGSVAGWTWSSLSTSNFPSKLLVETPVRNLFMSGIYAATELFLGGVPTAVRTADLAADLVLSSGP